jgi:cytochrome d ubiquinol oxidase subunit I
MIFTGLWSLWLRKRDTLYTSRPFLYLALWMGPSGLIAILAGWFTTEIGRQPWVVYGLMRTADASSNHSFMQMSITLVMFVVVYFALFGAGLGYMMRLVRKGRRPTKARKPTGGPGQKRTPARPLSAADDGSRCRPHHDQGDLNHGY